MKVNDFLKELKKLDERLEVVPNRNRGPNEENRNGISNIKLNGQDICPIPSEDIFDEPDSNYGYIFPNGMKGRFKTRPEALSEVERVLKMVKSKDGSDAFMGKGEYDTKK